MSWWLLLVKHRIVNSALLTGLRSVQSHTSRGSDMLFLMLCSVSSVRADHLCSELPAWTDQITKSVCGLHWCKQLDAFAGSVQSQCSPLCLQDFCAMVNDIGERARSRCMECKQGSGLIKCKGCSVAAHPTCVGLNSRQQQVSWLVYILAFLACRLQCMQMPVSFWIQQLVSTDDSSAWLKRWLISMVIKMTHQHDTMVNACISCIMSSKECMT